jgi:GR25 family glycosyltransferase involved in LPS biosynthesis
MVASNRMNVKAFIISLPQATDRKAQVQRIRSSCPLACDVIDAVDGRSMSAEERNKYIAKKLYRPHFPFDLRPGEIGHFLSQRKAWQTIIDQGLDAALLLEDDIELNDSIFNHGLSLAINSIHSMDVIKFRAPTRGRRPPLLQSMPEVQSPALAPLGTTSLLVARGAAERLLSLTERFDRPADAFLQLSWVTGIQPKIVVPAGVEEVSHMLGGSTIQSKKRSFRETIYRNIARPWYRMQLHSIAQWKRLTSTDLSRLTVTTSN